MSLGGSYLLTQGCLYVFLRLGASGGTFSVSVPGLWRVSSWLADLLAEQVWDLTTQ